MAQSSASVTQPSEVGAQLNRLLGDDLRKWPVRIHGRVGDESLSIAPLRLGLYGEIGVLVAGAERADFPAQTEELLLRVAANQAVIALHEARLRNEQNRLADELDRRVAQRTKELRQSELNLRNTQAELANMTRVMTVGQLTASIAHEVNQPLSGIITNAGTCLRMLDADPPNVEGARETARRTIRDGNRAADVITRLRALFSKRQAAVESFDLNEAISLLLDTLQTTQVILRSDLADDLPPVAGDRVQLQQVIVNLLQNAADAINNLHDRSRELLIQTRRDEADHVRLIVQDSGIGLDPHAVGRVFDAFYSTKNGGMGIGLAISRSIIENHQGRIWATPNDGPGATFSFSIPRSSGSAIGGRLPDSARESAANQPAGS
jgi:signal transduction histidine kinase